MIHSPIKFIKSLEKIEDDLWLYTPGKHNAVSLRMWIKHEPYLDGVKCRIYKQHPSEQPLAEVFTDCMTMYEACTEILKWFWDITDYENDPARLSRLKDDYSNGIGSIPEFVINPKSSDVLRKAEMQAKQSSQLSTI